ncbi:MAG: hypothetical protein ACOYIR_00090 [Christensenellales bacterium]|jgi:hypothetical protein
MLVLLSVFAAIALFDLAPLIQQKQRTVIAAFLVLFVLALGISILLMMDIEVPSAMLFLEDVLKSIGLSY